MPDSTPARPAQSVATSARLSFGATGAAVSVHEHLRFQLDHALARDAVHTPLDTALLERRLRGRGLTPVLLRSNASAAATGPEARKTYLRRPDLGRTLHPDSIAALQSHRIPGAPSVNSDGWGPHASNPRTLFLMADGLSALALERHALPLLDAVLPLLIPIPYSLFPLVQNARVAIADQIGALLGAQLTVLLIGERPGLSSPDSLGCYITWDPQPGKTTDAERNCISNIRGAEGLSYAEAAHRIAHYIHQARRLHTTGTALKDPTTSTPLL